MPRRSRVSAVLRSGGLAIHYYIGLVFNVGFASQSCLLATFSAAAILLASAADRSLLLSGRDVGLLQHPAIWSFFLLQAALPILIRRSLRRILVARHVLREVTGMTRNYSEAVVKPLLTFIRLDSAESKLVAAVFYLVGFATFVWNTYQNQQPGIIVPYDFWDSINYPWGFWVTRAYKLYLFVWLLPYIALVHTGVLVVVLSLVRRARTASKLRLTPYHRDRLGGLGFIPGLVTTPVVVTLLISSIPVAGAFQVHRAMDVTPLIGLCLILISASIAYAIPMIFLRTDIVSVKRDMIRKMRSQQQDYWARALKNGAANFEALKQSNEALDYFDKLCAKVDAIPNYPHLDRLLRYMGLALTPSVVSLAIKILESWNKSPPTFQ
jgi:hypothetical protein